MRVPAAISDSGTAPATWLAIACASGLPTPERSSTRAKLSPCPSVAVSSICGRSGVWASGRTASVAAI